MGTRWYAVALLTAPLVDAMAVLLALSLLSPEFLPGIFASADKASLLLVGIAAGLMVGVFEELGWTGFAVPRLRLRYGVLTTGLIVGVLWGAWHFLGNVWASGASAGALSLALFLTRELFFLRGTAGLQGAHGVGLRAYREPARGDSHAREPHRRQVHARASRDGDEPRDLGPGVGRRVVDRRAAVAVANGGHLSRQPRQPLRKRAA